MTAARLLIVGASVRAAADSARRAGFDPIGIDRFGDLDLQACCPNVKLDDFPRGLLATVKSLPEAPWMYTGPLENRTDLIADLSQVRTLYGNAADTVSQLRDPFYLATVLRQEGLRTPTVRTSSSRPQGGNLAA